MKRRVLPIEMDTILGLLALLAIVGIAVAIPILAVAMLLKIFEILRKKPSVFAETNSSHVTRVKASQVERFDW